MFFDLKRRIKDFLKSYFYIFKTYNKFTPAVQIAQRQIFHYYQDTASRGKVPALSDTGFRVFSQYEEDGMLLFIFAVIGTFNKTFIEIGSNDGVNSNCANLAINFGWHGLFIDGNETSIRRGKRFYKRYPDPWSYPPDFICAMVDRENINKLISDAGMLGETDLLSIDIDGNDYWIWEALHVVNPRVVIIETHVEFGYHNIVVPYDANYAYPGRHPVYHGASVTAMNKLAKKKGYRLVGANRYGHNTIYVKNGFGDELIPEVSVESVLQHPSATGSFKLFEEIKDWEYHEG
jgi:hypothetical protein